jgi:plastocyanin
MMQNDPSGFSTRIRIATVVALAVIVCTGFAWDSFSSGLVAVTQQDRVFHPNRLAVNRGDTVDIVNDDGELLHHAYVATDDFSFDSGEQEPGSNTDVRFNQAGTFTVRCRIHPKMSLVVTVK